MDDIEYIEDIKKRIDYGIIYLSGGGKSFKVLDIMIGVDNDNSITVTGWSKSNNVNNPYLLTKKVALYELGKVKETFFDLVDVSDTLNKFIKNKEIVFYLGIIAGQGGTGICYEKGGSITWIWKFKD